MKPFRFPLQRVLDVKLVMEEQQQLALAAAEHKLTAAQAALTDATDAHASAVALGNDGAVSADPFLRALNWRGRARLLQRVHECTVSVEQSRLDRDEERETLVTRHQERRVLELLEGKQRDRHRLEQLRRQQALVDDLTGATYKRAERRNDDE